MDDYLKAAMAAEAEAKRVKRRVEDRAALIVRMLTGGNEAARTQAAASVERACWAEERLAVIRDLPNGHDLLTNALARAMYEIASRPGAS